MKNIRAILFDSEGVVIDTESIWDKEQTLFLKKRGIDYNREELKPLLTGKSIIEGAKIIKDLYNLEENVQDLADERKNNIKSLFENNVEFVDGFIDFYNKVKDNYKICIVASTKRELLDLIDKKLNLKELFGGNVFCIEDINAKSKPNPEIYQYASEKLGVDVSNCLVIEDSPYGIEAAKNAKMKCFGITTTYDKELLSKADKIVDSFEEIEL